MTPTTNNNILVEQLLTFNAQAACVTSWTGNTVPGSALLCSKVCSVHRCNHVCIHVRGDGAGT